MVIVLGTRAHGSEGATMGPDQHPVDHEHAYPPCRVVKRLSDETAQTPGMNRRVAIDKDSVGSEKLWFGRVTCPPGLNSGPHHHGEAETAGHMLSGDRVRVYYGENYEQFIEVEPGDYLFVPAYTPHIEVNMSDSTPGEFITARSPDNIVIALDADADKVKHVPRSGADDAR